MASEAHDLHTDLAARWLRRNGFGVVATEISAAGCREEPDAVGFRSTCSALVEVKVSRADYLADRSKPERTTPGLGIGVYRFFLCPEGLIVPDEIPAGWGLLYGARGGRINEVLRPMGNLWPPFGAQSAVASGWSAFQHQPNLAAERQLLFSIALRLAGGKVPQRKRLPRI
jgi:hypothetical protein